MIMNFWNWTRKIIYSFMLKRTRSTLYHYDFNGLTEEELISIFSYSGIRKDDLLTIIREVNIAKLRVNRLV